MRILATLLSYPLFWLALPFLLTHPKLRRGIRERFGYPPQAPQSPHPRVWLHGASAGDITALRPTAMELRSQHPNLEIILSTVTDSGYAMAHKLSPLFDVITYQPYDLPGSVGRALDRLTPSLLVLEYTELWPQLIYAARERSIPVFLHNGRFSAASMGRYRLLFSLTGNLLEPLTRLLLRDDHEAERARVLGAAPDQILVTGNTKFDNLASPPDPNVVTTLREAFRFTKNDLVWLAGSTHEGEEEGLLEVFNELREEFPSLKMVIAPRYLERLDRITQLVTRAGFTCARRSSPGEGPAEVSLLDTVGELSTCYALGTVIFVGGSFVPRGGQNILEPAGCGRPVVFGPFMRNFPDSVQVLLGRGGLQVATPAKLGEVLLELLGRPTYREELGAMARVQVQRARGAARRNATEILSHLPG